MGGVIEVLSKSECRQLLEHALVGRIGVCVGAMPEILPVNFRLIDEAITFRTGEGTKLHAASRQAVVAFEVDDFSPDAERGWSVLVIGESEEVMDPDEVKRARDELPDGWVPGTRDHVIRIVPSRISGRRIYGS